MLDQRPNRGCPPMLLEKEPGGGAVFSRSATVLHVAVVANHIPRLPNGEGWRCVGSGLHSSRLGALLPRPSFRCASGACQADGRGVDGLFFGRRTRSRTHAIDLRMQAQCKAISWKSAMCGCGSSCSPLQRVALGEHLARLVVGNSSEPLASLWKRPQVFPGDPRSIQPSHDRRSLCRDAPT